MCSSDLAGYGFLMSASGLGALISALRIAGQKRSRPMLIGAGALILGSMEILLGVSRVYPLSLAAMLVVGFGSVSMTATANATVQLHVPDQLRGRVMSIYMTIFVGSTPVGSLIVGILAIFIFGFPSAGASVLGISLLIAIVGFAAQSVLRDIIAGTMVVAERWFDVGDAITIEPWAMSGIVEAINLRSVKLRGLDGATIRIHNQHMYGVRVARHGIKQFVLEIYVTDAAQGQIGRAHV